MIDDRSVDYVALAAQQRGEDEAEGLTNQTINIYQIDTNSLWLEVPSDGLADPTRLKVILHNTGQGQSYTLLTTTNLLSPAWAAELTTNGSAGNATEVELSRIARPMLFVCARESTPYSFYVSMPPLSQDVEDGDTVTFYAETGGNTNLTFQWTFNGADIPGATNRSCTIFSVQDSDAGNYACMISDGTNSLVTPAAQLTTDYVNMVGPFTTGDINLIPVLGMRQNYTFRSGMTYYIGSPIQLYGNTTIEAGTVLKFDYDNFTNSSLVILGGLTCTTSPYNPAILTSIDDDSAGEWIYLSTGSPQTIISGTPYLELASATNNSISNLRFCFADWGVTTPVTTPRLDVWDCQFVACNYGVVNLVAGSSTDSLHNVLFAACGAAVGASTNSITVQGEQVTAHVGAFCQASSTPALIALTNSIVWGNPISASTVSTVNVAMNPDGGNFRRAGEGHYYLAANSPLHGAGTANISPRLQTELQRKTTWPPIAIAVNTQISGQITLSPQAPRYTNGAPDLGYYYDALDYTVANLYLAGGNLTVLPGTAIGIRNDYIASGGYWTIWGIYVNEGGTVTSHGTQNKPNIFTDADLVQEKPNTNFGEYIVAIGTITGGFPESLPSTPTLRRATPRRQLWTFVSQISTFPRQTCIFVRECRTTATGISPLTVRSI